MNLHFQFKLGLEDGERYSLKEILIPHILAAIGTNEYLRDKIQIEYDQKRNLFSSVNEEFSYPYYNYFKLFPSVERLIINKTLQMYLYAESQQQGDEFLTEYLNEGFKRIIDYVNRSDTFSFAPFIQFLNQRENEMSGSKKWHLTSIYLYQCCLQNMYVDSDSSPFKEIMYNLVLPLRYNQEYFKKGLSLSAAEQQKALSKYQELLGAKVPKSQTLNSFFVQLNEKLMRELKPKLKRTIKYNLSHLNSQSLTRTYKTMTEFLRTFYIEDSYYIQNISLTREEYLQIYAVFKRSLELRRIKEEEFDLFFSSSLLLMVMCKHYNRLSEAFFEQNQEIDSNIKTREAADTLIRTEKENLKQEKLNFEAEKKDLLFQLSNLQQQLSEKDRALNFAKEVNQISEEEKEELRVLRDFVFNLNKDEKEYLLEDIADNNAIKQLQQMELNIAVFGGHPRLHQRMKEVFRFVRTVEPEELSIDLSFVSQMDVILFVATYNNHAQYKRFRLQWRKNKTKLIFINNQSSIEIIARRILQEVNTK